MDGVGNRCLELVPVEFDDPCVSNDCFRQPRVIKKTGCLSAQQGLRAHTSTDKANFRPGKKKWGSPEALWIKAQCRE